MYKASNWLFLMCQDGKGFYLLCKERFVNFAARLKKGLFLMCKPRNGLLISLSGYERVVISWFGLVWFVLDLFGI